MNIEHIGGAVNSTPVSTISFAVAFLAVVAIFGIKPLLKKKKIDMAGDLPAMMLVIVAAVGFSMGIGYNQQKELIADNAAFTEQLKNDYGVTTKADLSEIRRSATYERFIVMSDPKGDFEARPHVDGYNLTFFRVDNGAQVKRLDS